MVQYENECRGCATPGYPCKGASCSYRKVPHYYCDKCKWEFKPSELYKYEGQELCVECLVDNFSTVEKE